MARIDELEVGETYRYSTYTTGPPMSHGSFTFGVFEGVEKVEVRYYPKHGWSTKTRTERHARFRPLGRISNGEISPTVRINNNGKGWLEVPASEISTAEYSEVRSPSAVDLRPFDLDAYLEEVGRERRAEDERRGRLRTEVLTRLIPALDHLTDLLGPNIPDYDVARYQISKHGMKSREDQIAALMRAGGSATLSCFADVFEAQGVLKEDGVPLIAPKEDA